MPDVSAIKFCRNYQLKTTRSGLLPLIKICFTFTRFICDQNMKIIRYNPCNYTFEYLQRQH